MNRPGLRRALHAATALIVPAGLWVGWDQARWALTAAVPLALVFEQLRFRTGLGPWLAGRLPVFRAHEMRRYSGAFWLLVGMAAASWFAVPAAYAGVLAGALADPLASVVGARLGSRTAQKTLAGTSACFVTVTSIAAYFGLGSLEAVLIGSCGAALERWSGPVDDNLVLAPGVAAVFWVLALTWP